MKKRKITVLVAGLILLTVGGSVWWALGSGEDPQVQKVRELQKELFVEGKLPERENFEKFHKAMKQLTPEQRREVRRPMRENMQRHMNERIDAFFALPVQQRNAYLDKQIKEMEQWRKQWEARRPQNDQARNRSGQGPASTQNRPGANAGGPPGGRHVRTADERNQRRNRRLDHTTPEQRAKWTAYFSALQKRRTELGLPAFPPHGRRGPRH